MIIPDYFRVIWVSENTQPFLCDCQNLFSNNYTLIETVAHGIVYTEKKWKHLGLCLIVATFLLCHIYFIIDIFVCGILK